MRRKAWFGNRNKFQWVPCPATGMEASMRGWSETTLFLNGGLAVTRSNQHHRTYSMNFPVDDYENLNIFQQYRNGFYGPGPFYWVDPMVSDINLMAPAWAHPRLIQHGWTNIGPVEPTFVDLSGVIAARFSFDTSMPTYNYSNTPNMLLPIPEGMTLDFIIHGFGHPIYFSTWREGVSTPLSTNEVLWSTVISVTKTSADYVTIHIGYDGSTNKEVTLIESSAVLRKTGDPVTVFPAVFNAKPGEGNTGLDFLDDAAPITYQTTHGKRVGLSTNLGEVGAWL